MADLSDADFVWVPAVTVEVTGCGPFASPGTGITGWGGPRTLQAAGEVTARDTLHAFADGHRGTAVGVVSARDLNTSSGAWITNFGIRITQGRIRPTAVHALVVDTNWLNYWKQRFNEPLDDAESLVIDDEGYISSIGQKIKKLDQAQAQYIGLMKFQGKGLEQLKSFYDQSKALSKSGKNPLNPNLDFNKSYMTDLLQGMINNGIKIKAIPIKNSWLELDSYNDYLLYSQMYKNKTLTEFFHVNT